MRVRGTRLQFSNRWNRAAEAAARNAGILPATPKWRVDGLGDQTYEQDIFPPMGIEAPPRF